MADLLTSLDEICTHLKIQEKALKSLLSLGLPVRNINGRYYAHAAVIDEWLRWFLNPAASGGAAEIDTIVRASGARGPRPPAKETRRKAGTKKPLRWSKPT
jgi:hypothetical protein